MSIDLDHLERYVCGDAALRAEILTIYQDQAKMLREKLSADIDDENWENALHSLKGASRGIGAFQVGNLAEKGEKLIADCPNKEDVRTVLLHALDEEINVVLNEARRLCEAA